MLIKKSFNIYSKYIKMQKVSCMNIWGFREMKASTFSANERL